LDSTLFTEVALLEEEAEYARMRADDERLQTLQRELDTCQADRAARLSSIRELERWLKQSEADRAARLRSIEELEQLLTVSEADRAARLDNMNELQRLLAVSEADRAARLRNMNELQRLLEACQADRSADLDLSEPVVEQPSETSGEKPPEGRAAIAAWQSLTRQICREGLRRTLTVFNRTSGL
jgi:hypothetical protein